MPLTPPGELDFLEAEHGLAAVGPSGLTGAAPSKATHMRHPQDPSHPYCSTVKGKTLAPSWEQATCVNCWAALRADQAAARAAGGMPPAATAKRKRAA